MEMLFDYVDYILYVFVKGWNETVQKLYLKEKMKKVN